MPKQNPKRKPTTKRRGRAPAKARDFGRLSRLILRQQETERLLDIAIEVIFELKELLDRKSLEMEGQPKESNELLNSLLDKLSGLVPTEAEGSSDPPSL